MCALHLFPLMHNSLDLGVECSLVYKKTAFCYSHYVTEQMKPNPGGCYGTLLQVLM